MKNVILFVLMLMTLIASGQNSDQPTPIPIPLPQWTPPTGTSGQDDQLIGFDPATQREFHLSQPEMIPGKTSDQTEGFIPGNLENADEIIGLKNFGTMEPIGNTSEYPYSAIVKLYIRFRDTPANMVYEGSGIFFGSTSILTAGHCVYNQEHGGWATSIHVVPGYSETQVPFGVEDACGWNSFIGWVDHSNYEYDMAFVRLPVPLGYQTGYFNAGYDNSDDFFRNNTFNNLGYPADYPFNGNVMYHWYGRIDRVTKNIVYINNVSYGGQSGSGLYFKRSANERCVYGILSHGDNSSTGFTRLTEGKFPAIRDWFFAGTNETKGVVKMPVRIYPNPVRDNIAIYSGSRLQQATVTIFDITGSRIMEQSATAADGKIILPASGLPEGFYIVRIQEGNQTGTATFVKAGE